MICDVVSAVYKGGYKIKLTFDDGKTGIVDFSEYLSKGGVFDHFRDIDFFINFSVNDELGTLTWRNDIDIAPEQLYAKATGNPLPEWMEV
ncbi:MAG: DUF2442 domain-containing protein [Candidatus Electrothrix sp. EH2]|nr:DUF2442 domain-containing protein [Candidatus Electrothrix sp. EH2]